jgi:hypothetical protein
MHDSTALIKSMDAAADEIEAGYPRLPQRERDRLAKVWSARPFAAVNEPAQLRADNDKLRSALQRATACINKMAERWAERGNPFVSKPPQRPLRRLAPPITPAAPPLHPQPFKYLPLRTR